jgi:membrane protease YdiL (CAAX protease family)
MFEKESQENFNNPKEYSDAVVYKTPGIQNSSIMFSLIVILYLYIAAYFQRKGFVSGVLITEFIIILIPPLIFLKLKDMEPTYVLRLNKVSIPVLFQSIGILIFSLPLVFTVNGLYIFFIKKVFGSISTPNIPVAKDFPELMLFFFVIGVSAGICEEVLFRGFIMRGFESFGATKSILLTGVLFGMLHISIERIPATLLLGVIIGFVVYRTNSIFTGILMHFTNNSLSTFLTYIFNKINPDAINNNLATQPDTSALLNGSPESIFVIIFLASLLVFFNIGCLFILYFITKKLLKDTQYLHSEIENNTISIKNKNLLWLIPGIFLLIFLTFGEGLKLLNIDSTIYERIINILKINLR